MQLPPRGTCLSLAAESDARRMYSQACSYLASDYAIWYLFKKLKRVLSLHLLNFKNDGPVLLFKTTFGYSFFLSIATDGMIDKHVLKHEKIEPTF